MSGDNIHNDPRLDEWRGFGEANPALSEPQRYDPSGNYNSEATTREKVWRQIPEQPGAAPVSPLEETLHAARRGPELYQAPPPPAAPTPAPNRSLVAEDTQSAARVSKLSIGRRILMAAFCFVGLFGLIADLRGLASIETGLIFLLATLVGSAAIHGLATRHVIIRAILSIAIAACASAAATFILPTLGLWPQETSGLLIAMTFATVGTLTHSRICLGIALIVLVNMLFQDGGLGLMPGRTQIAVLALFGIGLLGGVTTGSRFIATVSLLALFLAHMHIMASSALPSGSALGVTFITALCAAALLRSTMKRGLTAAFEPMAAAILVFVVAALTFQLVLLGGNGGPDMLETAPMRGSVVSVLLAAQAFVFLSSLYDWFENRVSLQSVLAVQAVLAALTVMLVDPRRMGFIPGFDAATEMALCVGLILAVIVLRVLFHAWQKDKPILTAACALILMVEAIILLQFAVTGMDIAVTALVCAAVAIVLAAMMSVFGRKTPNVTAS